MFSTSVLSLIGGLLASVPAVAGFSSSANNVAVYWGQNSYGQGSGTLSQQRLSYYCANTELNIIPLAFLVSIANPTLNFANSGNACTAISGSSLFYCSELEADIATCQSTYGKTILLSIGGATYSEGGFSSSAAAISAANNLWSIFGPKTGSSPRPFGNSVIDGFDFDFESSVSNMVPFAQQLRSLMTASSASTGKEYFLTAAPQCPYPDAADGPMLAGQVYFDAIFVQFYNNYCGIQSYVGGSTNQNNFNFATWDNWAKTSSLNPNVKVLVGVPGASTAAGSGYVDSSSLASTINYAKTFSSFGGVMIWDATQVYANGGFLDGISSALGGVATGSTSSGSKEVPPPSNPAPSAPATTLATVVVPVTPSNPTPPPASGSSSGTVAQWNQCGGQGWNGGTVCVSGFSCKYYSAWYSMCV